MKVRNFVVGFLAMVCVVLGLQTVPAQAASGYVYSSISSVRCVTFQYENGGYGNLCPGKTVYNVNQTNIPTGYKATWSKNGTIQATAYGPRWISTHTYAGNSYRITVTRR